MEIDGKNLKRKVYKMTNLPSNTALPDLIDRILDKGLVINADIKIDLAGTEILGIKLRAALASFETAAKFGLAFPSGTNLNAPAWRQLECSPEAFCPECGKALYSKTEKLCSCGWGSFTIKQKNKKLLEVQQKNESHNTKMQINANQPNLEKA